MKVMVFLILLFASLLGFTKDIKNISQVTITAEAEQKSLFIEKNSSLIQEKIYKMAVENLEYKCLQVGMKYIDYDSIEIIKQSHIGRQLPGNSGVRKAKFKATIRGTCHREENL